MDPNAMHQKPPPPHVSSKGVWITKFIFRVFSAIFAIILIGIAAGMSVQGNSVIYDDDDDYYYGYSYYYWSAGPLAVLIPPAVVSFIWNVAEGICLLARRGHRGIHPGAIIAVDLLLWLGFIGCTVCFGLFLWVGTYGYSYNNSGELTSEGETISALGAAAIAFGSMLSITHITLFIFGCYECAVRNRNHSQPAVIVYGGPPGPHQSMYGQPPMAYGQPIMLPAGQPPPAGYIPYPFPPQQQQGQFPQPGEQQQQPYSQNQQQPQPQQPSSLSTSPPPQEPSPVHTTSTRQANDWRNSHQVPQNDQQNSVRYG